MEDALLRDDGPDQESDQHDNRYGQPADPVELIDQRCHPQRSRPAQQAEDGQKKRAQHLQEYGHVFGGLDRGAADFVHLDHDGISRRRRRGIVTVDLTDLLDQARIVLGNADDVGAMAGRGYTP